MSASIRIGLSPDDSRPTRPGTRRRPRARTLEIRRPSAVYHQALRVAFARISVIDRLRDDGFNAS